MQGLWCFCIYFMGINKVRLLRLFEMRLLLLILSKCLHVIAVGFLPISTAIFAKNSFICNYLYLDRFKEIISDVTYQCFPNDRLVVHEDIIMQNKMNCKLQVRRVCYSDSIIDNHLLMQRFRSYTVCNTSMPTHAVRYRHTSHFEVTLYINHKSK